MGLLISSFIRATEEKVEKPGNEVRVCGNRGLVHHGKHVKVI